MKVVKGVLFVLTGLFILVTLFSLLMPSRIITVRSVNIKAKKELVMQAVSNLQEWKQWHPLLESKEVIFSNSNNGKVGSRASWIETDKTVSINLTQVLEDGIAFTVNRKGDNAFENNITLTPVAGTDSLEVVWRAVTKLKWYPWEKFSGIFINELTGPGYQAALNSLKQYAERSGITMGN